MWLISGRRCTRHRWHPDRGAAHAAQCRPSRRSELGKRACERAVDFAGQELGDIRTARSVISNKIIDVILRLYRQADGPMRVRCLDLIDRLTVSGAYGLGEALARER